MGGGALDQGTLQKLAGSRGTLGRVITKPRACGECGYDLKGLRYGGTCPECGTPIAIRRRQREPDMGDSPSVYLFRMAGGMTMLALGGVGWLAWLVVVPLLGLLGGFRLVFHPVAVGAIALVWVLGTLLVLAERPFAKSRRQEKGTGPEWLALRLTILVTQLAGLVAAGAFALAYYQGVAAWMVAVLASLALMFLGWAPLCVYLSRIAYWAGDDEMGARFHGMSMWVAALGLGAAFIFGPSYSFLTAMRWVGVVCFLFFMIFSVIVMLAILRMSNTIRWTARNAGEARARDRRVAEKAREAAERALREAEERLGAGTAMAAEREALMEEIERKHAAIEAARERGEDGIEHPEVGHQTVVEPSEDVEAFDLEGDGGGRSPGGGGG